MSWLIYGGNLGHVCPTTLHSLRMKFELTAPVDLDEKLIEHVDSRGGGGGSLIFSHIRRLGLFFGFKF